jgi:hypothetical protein
MDVHHSSEKRIYYRNSLVLLTNKIQPPSERACNVEVVVVVVVVIWMEHAPSPAWSLLCDSKPKGMANAIQPHDQHGLIAP